jgi:hypothetical protein
VHNNKQLFYLFDLVGTEYNVNYEHPASNLPLGGPYEIRVSMPAYGGVSNSVFPVMITN